MRKKIALIFLMGLFLLGLTPRRSEPHFNGKIPGDYSRVLIKLHPEADLKALIKDYAIENYRKLLLKGWIAVKVPKGSQLLEYLATDPRVLWAEPDHPAWISEEEDEVLPNDEYFGEQWYLRNTGSKNGYKRGADVKATYAWKYTTGSEDIIVAVVDTGVAYNHPDLKGKVIKGYDFINSDEDPKDDNGHGTMVAGIIAAKSNNGEGIAGVCWNCKIMAIKSFDATGLGTYSELADGIEYAIERGAKVINISAGGDSPSLVLEEALDKAEQNGVVIVAAAGNNGGALLYPAAYSPKCISVGASDYEDRKAGFSNYGPHLDLVAPGVYIISTFPGGYAIGSGTSFAAPIISGAVGLLLSLKPNLTPDQVRKALIYTTDDVNSESLPGFDYYMGYGRANLLLLFEPIKLE